MWFGPTPRLTVADPDLIREIFVSKSEFYEKNESHPVVRQLEGDGLLSLKGEKWAHRRRIVSPTFHMENLKANSLLQPTLHPLPTLTSSSPSQFSPPLFRHPQMLIPSMGRNVVEVVEKWEEEAARSGSGEKEIDVSECFQSLTEEMITRTAFGVSYEDGRSVFGLQTQQMMFAAEAFNKVFVPGYR